ncbi:tetratricopeptide repeat protein [bacterium]|nr:tetratricopeptide repeat protein [bacterium]
MKKSYKNILLTLMAFIFFSGSNNIAAQTGVFFREANQLYQGGHYLEAVKSYQKILDEGYESGSVYYNIGNCYYKMQDIGHAILYYERARRLMPGDEDLKANLALANLSVVDKITPQSEFIVFRIVDWFIHIFPQSTLVGVVIGTYLITISFLVIWIVTKKGTLQLVGFRLSIFFGTLFLVFGLSLIGNIRESKTRIEAIILTDKIDALSAPSEEGIEVFSLHEGVKVTIDQTAGEWAEFVLADGKVGWVKQESLGII